MKRNLGIAAIGCALGSANARLLNWGEQAPRWLPPQATLAVKPRLDGMSPRPTEAPKFFAARSPLERRGNGDNTCAYVNGDPNSVLSCPATDACVYNSLNSYIGCCPETSTTCPIPTSCYDSTDSSLFSGSSTYTVFCSDSTAPYCVSYLYDDPTFRGYTILGCDVTPGVQTVYFSSNSDFTSSESSSFLSSSSGGSGSSTVATSVSTIITVSPQSSSASPSSSTPIGPIVGGVVGGVAALALIGLGVFFLIRQNKKSAAATPPSAPPANVVPGPAVAGVASPAPGYPQSPAMSQQYSPMPGYNRDSIAKPYGYDSAQPIDNSSSGTPSTQYPYGPASPSAPSMYAQNTYGQPTSPANTVYSTPPLYAPGQQPYGQPMPQQGYPQPGGGYPQAYPQAYPPQQQPYQVAHAQHNPAFAAELPTTRGDGEVRELE